MDCNIECAGLFEVAQKHFIDKKMKYQEFLYKNTFYLIDNKKLDFTLSILKTNKQSFFEIENLRSFFEEYELLSEEFLEFISINQRTIEKK